MKLRFLSLLLLLLPAVIFAQGSIGVQPVQVTQGGHTVTVTSGGSAQVDLFSVSGSAITLSSGGIPVTIVSGGGSGGTSIADEGTFVPGTTAGTPASCFFQTTVTNNALTNLQAGANQCTARRAQYMNIDAVGGTTFTLGQTTMSASLPVTIASNQSVLEVGPTTSANTVSNTFFTQVGDGTHAVTLNSTTYSSKYGLDENLLGTLGTAFSTAGKVDVKGADGDVFVRQPTGTNLHVVTDSTSATGLNAGTNLIGYTRPPNSCGNTFYESGMAFLPNTLTSLTTTTTCIDYLVLNNTTSSAVTITAVQDQSTACNSAACQIVTSFSLPADSSVSIALHGTKFTSGIKWQAGTATAVTANIIGNQ